MRSFNLQLAFSQGSPACLNTKIACSYEHKNRLLSFTQGSPARLNIMIACSQGLPARLNIRIAYLPVHKDRLLICTQGSPSCLHTRIPCSTAHKDPYYSGQVCNYLGLVYQQHRMLRPKLHTWTNFAQTF